MTFGELKAKYERAALVVRSLVDAKVEAEWDMYTTHEAYHTVHVYTPEDESNGYVWEIYDRADSPIDKEMLGSRDEELWVVLHSEGREVEAATLVEAVVEAVARGWLPPQPDPTLWRGIMI